MPEEIIFYITNYGYLAIFLLVFSQEIGIPNPIPNELVLIFSGYLAFQGILSLPLVILTAISADFIGTNILYCIFYFFGKYILQHKPRWLPISEKRIETLRNRISKGGLWTIYLGRITPFIRGYTSVITGLLQIKPKVFLPIVIISASTWSVLFIVIGRILGPYWSSAGNGIANLKFVVLLVLIIAVAFLGFRHLKSRIIINRKSKNNI